jgi:hypothetical protein
MPALTRRRDLEAADECWHVHYGDVRAGDQELLALLRPCPDDRLKIWRIDNKVGNVRNTGPELILPLEETLL